MDEKLNRRLAEFVRMNREKADLSINQLANMTGISKSQISLIEGSGDFKNNPRLGTLIKICNALDTDLVKLSKYLTKK